MATLTVANVVTTGLGPTAVALTATGNAFTNDGRTVLYLVNAATAAGTATVLSTTACNQGSTHNVTVTLAKSATTLAGVFDPSRYGTTTTFNVSASGTITGAASRV